MTKFIKLKTCLAHSNEFSYQFGTKRLCFQDAKNEKKETAPGEESAKKALDLSHLTPEEIKAVKAKYDNREEISLAFDAGELAKMKQELEAQKQKISSGPKNPDEALKKEDDKDKAESKPENPNPKKTSIGSGDKPKSETPEPDEANEAAKKFGGPHIPERAKDAMTGKEMMKEFEKCKNERQKRDLLLDQLAKGNVPESYRKGFQTVTVIKNGRKLEYRVAPSGFRFGTDDDFMEFPTNGPMAQALADATKTMLPTQWMVDQNYKYAKSKGQFVAFEGQVMTKEDTQFMRSPEFIQTHYDKFMGWAKQHNVDVQKMNGYFKQVVMQSPDQMAKGISHGFKEGNLDIYGGISAYRTIKNPDGTTMEVPHIIEPGHVAHDIYHDDYSQNFQAALPIAYVDDKPVKLEDVLTDKELAAHFGFPPLEKINKYHYGPEVAQAVARIKQMSSGKPIEEIDAGAYEESPKIKPEVSSAFTAISKEELAKGKVMWQYDYKIGASQGGHASFIKTNKDDIALVEYEGKEHQLKVDLDPEHITNKVPENYSPANAGKTKIIRPFGYVMLGYFMKNNLPFGSTVKFEYNGKKYVAQYQMHPADAGLDHDHPGVGLLVQNGQSEDETPLPQNEGTPNQLNPTPQNLESQSPGPQLPSQNPEPVAVSVKPTGGRRVRAVITSASRANRPADSNPQPLNPPETAQSALKPSSPEAPPIKTAEGREAPPTIPYTTLGDSITVGVEAQSRGSRIQLPYHNRPNPDSPGNPEQVGQNTRYMKNQLKSEVIPSLKENGIKVIVLGGGANEFLGVSLPNDEAANKIVKRTTDNFLSMWRDCHDNGLKVVAMTMPPFDRYIDHHYQGPERDRCYEVWQEINKFIMEHEGREGGPDKVVKAHEILGQQVGENWLIQDQYITQKPTNDSQRIHPLPSGYGAIAKEVEKAVNTLSDKS